jgi:hypothetical protein
MRKAQSFSTASMELPWQQARVGGAQPPPRSLATPRAHILTIGRTSILQRPTTALRVRPAASATSTSLPLLSSDR